MEAKEASGAKDLTKRVNWTTGEMEKEQQLLNVWRRREGKIKREARHLHKVLQGRLDCSSSS